jgi:hypothetical protein
VWELRRRRGGDRRALGGAVARLEQDSGVEDRAGPEERMTRGWGRSRRWMAAAYTALPITIKAFISLVI